MGESYFGDDGNQNYSIFQPMSRYLKFVKNSQNISSLRSRGLLDEEIKVVNGYKIRLNLKVAVWLKQKLLHKIIVNIYIVYGIQQEILMIQNR